MPAPPIVLPIVLPAVLPVVPPVVMLVVLPAPAGGDQSPLVKGLAR